MSSPVSVRLRPATPADAPWLRQWDAQPHVIEAKGDEDWAWERTLAQPADWRDPRIAEADGRPVGYLEIIDPSRDPEKYWGDCPPGLRAIDLWIGEPDCLAQGFGTRMMREGLALCFANPGVTAVLVDPLIGNARARRFYERMGFRFVERRRFDQDDCAVYRLERADWAG